MIFMSALKRICNMCFYLTFATFFGYFFAYLLGLEISHFFVTFPIFIGVGFLSTFLDSRGWLKYLSFLPLALTFLIIPLTILNLLILLPLIIYMSWSTSEPLWAQKASGEYYFVLDHTPVFKRFMKFFIPILLLQLFLSLLFGRSITFPIDSLLFGLSFIIASVVFTRMIRHDEAIFAQLRFKAINAIPIMAVIIITILFVFGRDFLNLVWPSVIDNFDPSFVLEQIGGGGGAGGELSFEGTGGVAGYQYLELEGVEITLATRILIIITNILGFLAFAPLYIVGIPAIIIVLYWTIRAFWPSKGLTWRNTRNDGIEEEYFALDDPNDKQKKRPRRKENQIREIYREFLALLKEQNIDVSQHFTSREIEEEVARNLQSEKSSELRTEYIKVRYQEIEPTKSDIKKMKELYKNVKEEIEIFS